MPTTSGSIRYLSCSQCGLLNISERRTCKRCQATLDPTAKVSGPTPPPQRATLPWGCTIAFLSFWGLMFVLFVIRVIYPASPTVPTPGSAISFRGRSIALLRMVSRPPYEGLEVQDDGQASRFSYPIDAGSPSTQFVLTDTELEAIQQLRREWCRQPPTLRPLAQNEPFDDLAFECGGYTTKQVKVPQDMRPSPFEELVQRIPHPTR